MGFEPMLLTELTQQANALTTRPKCLVQSIPARCIYVQFLLFHKQANGNRFQNIYQRFTHIRDLLNIRVKFIIRTQIKYRQNLTNYIIQRIQRDMLENSLKTKFSHDRFISTINQQYTSISTEYSCPEKMDAQQKTSYEMLISGEIFKNEMPDEICDQPRLFQNNYYMSDIRQLMSKKVEQAPKVQPKKYLKPQPEKILDAPELKDDYYLNLLDWSSKGQLAIGLEEKVYLYCPQKINLLCQKQQGDYICSLSFHPQGEQLAIGLSTGKTEIYDAQTETLVRTLKGHTSRVSSSAFTYGLLFTGSRDTKILGHDLRSAHNIVMKLEGHRGQVCGLKHDACGLASGSNDNLAMIWDITAGKIKHQLQGHKAAVKALAWCPWQRNLLATGGGSSDKTMRFWNTQTGKLINTVNTQSQVCSLVWNKNDKQILSSHGFSQNQLCLWKYPDCTKVGQLFGHTQRVLHMSLAPDNSTICTASADQTLRFWKVFQAGSSPFSQDKQMNKLNPKYYSLR